MARQLRSELPDGVFHVTTRGVDRCAIYRDDADRLTFLQLLADCVNRFEWIVHAFCLMTTHYHVIMETTVPQLARGLHRLNGVHALRFNKRHKRSGHLFGDRYASWVIEGEDYLTAACDYVLAKPRASRPLRPPGGLALEWLCERVSDRRDEHLFAATDPDTLGRLCLPKSWSFTVPGSTTSRTSPSGCRETG